MSYFLERGLVRGLSVVAAEPVGVFADGKGEVGLWDGWLVCEGRPRSRIRIRWVMTFGDGEDLLGIVDRQRKYGDAVKRAAGWQHAGRADSTPGWLQADNVVQTSWYPTGAGGVRAEGKRHNAPGDDNGAPGA